jgi:ankyrin repeat protein
MGVPDASGEASPIPTVGTAQIQSPVVVMTAVPPPVTTVVVSQPMTVVNQQTTIVNSIELASINQLDGSKEGKAPLHKAAEAGDTRMVAHLLQSGATVNLRNNWGFTPFLLAVQADHLAVCELLIHHGADPMEQHKTGWYAIHFAAWKGALKFVEYSIERKSFVPDLLSGDKVSALWYAAKYGHAQITKLLIDYGCNVNISNVYQDTALHWSAQNGHKECVELLLNGGADSQLKNNIRKKPSALAKKAKHPAIVELLKEAKKKLKTKK